MYLCLPVPACTNACRCLLLEGSASATLYSSKRGCEQRTVQLAPGDTWSEVALLHSSRPMRSSTTVVAGPQVRDCADRIYADQSTRARGPGRACTLRPDGATGQMLLATVLWRGAELAYAHGRYEGSSRPMHEQQHYRGAGAAGAERDCSTRD